MASQDTPNQTGEGAKYPVIDPARVGTVPVSRRENMVSADQVAGTPGRERSFADFLSGLPRILEANSFLAVVEAVARSVRERRGVLCMLGGHVVKTGLGPLLIDMMDRGAITHLALNGAAAIHDHELARWGGTSEDVEAGLADGSFGMAEETGREINEAICDGARQGWGLGESLSHSLATRHQTAHPELSLLLAARKRRIPVTVHTTIGAEITHQHPAADGGAIGATGHTDFLRLAAYLEHLEDGVVLNLGSAVVMPEVFLKALTVCRNVNQGAPRRFVAADFDMIRQYRALRNVVERPTRTGGGQGYQITGHHEIMLPLLCWAVAEELERNSGTQ